jgi:Tfp pilus assembly protein PilF
VPRRLILAALLALIAAVAAWLGVALYAENQFTAARRALERYDFAAANEHLQTCVRLRPNEFRYRLLAAQAARRAGSYREAEDHLDRCRVLAAEEGNVGLLEGMLLRAQQGKLAAVEKDLWILVEEDHPDKPLILEALGRGYLRSYRLPLADKCLKALLEAEPDHAEAWLWRAGILELVGNPDGALRLYRKALELRPENDAYRKRLALFLLYLNNAPEALPHLEQLHARQPDDPDVLVGLAQCRIAAGEAGAGRVLLRRALAVRPGHVQGLAEAAKLALLDGQPARARALARKALEAEPSDRAVNYLYYQCLLRCGKTEDARVQEAHFKILEKDLNRLEHILRNDLAENPQNPDNYCELGQIFSRHGRPDLGLYWYRHALALNPDHRPTHLALSGRPAGR